VTPEIRPERPDDIAAITAVVTEAFGRTDEARLVARLRTAGALSLSLVAAYDDQVVGHVAFSPVTVSGNPDGFAVWGLAPLAIVPLHQKAGIGRLLVKAGLDQAEAMGARAAVVLGDPAYYGRFGFVPAGLVGLEWDHPCPPGAFQVTALAERALTRLEGRVSYHAAFDAV